MRGRRVQARSKSAGLGLGRDSHGDRHALVLAHLGQGGVAEARWVLGLHFYITSLLHIL
jgi:hypothetical protein